jgi:hypothetical protein
MTTKPTPIQARAYADALIAWSEGKKVEQRHNAPSVVPDKRVWYPFNGEACTYYGEYRIVPDPPKAREFWINWYRSGNSYVKLAFPSPEDADNDAFRNRSSGHEQTIHVREILDTEIAVNKAEYEELCRNEAALKAAIKECSNQRKRSLPLDFYLDSHGAKL